MTRNTTELANELVHFFNEHYFSDEAIVGMWNTYLSDDEVVNLYQMLSNRKNK